MTIRIGAKKSLLASKSTGPWMLYSGGASYVRAAGSTDAAAYTLASPASVFAPANVTGTLSGVLSGSSVALAKNGAGTIVLTGANTYSGGTTISAGTLLVGNGGTGSITGAITNNGTFAVNLAAGYALSAYSITGGGAVSFKSSGDLTLDKTLTPSTYKVSTTGAITLGGVAVTAGNISVTATNRISLLSGSGTATFSGPVAMSSGIGLYYADGTTLVVGAAGQTSTLNFVSSTGWGFGGGTYVIAQGSNNTHLTTYGNVTINATYTGASGGGAAMSLAGHMSNSGGTLTINANAYSSSARTGIDGGINNIFGGTLYPSGTINITTTGPNTATSFGDINVPTFNGQADSSVSITGTNKGIYIGGFATETAGALSLSLIASSASGTITAQSYAGNYSLSGALLLKSAGSISITQGIGQIYAAGGLTVDNVGSADVISSSIVNKSGAAPTSFTKQGAGTLTLTATNTYTGATTINAGTLVIQGSATSSLHTVASGATISGGSAITGNIGPLTFSALASKLQVNAITTTSASKLTCTTLTATNGFTINVNGAMNAGTYPILTSTSGIPTPSLGTNTSGRTVAFAWSGNNLNMILT